MQTTETNADLGVPGNSCLETGLTLSYSGGDDYIRKTAHVQPRYADPDDFPKVMPIERRCECSW